MVPSFNYADEIVAIATSIYAIDKIAARKLDDIVYRMRRDATIKPNAKPTYAGGHPPISGGREVSVVRERRRG